MYAQRDALTHCKQCRITTAANVTVFALRAKTTRFPL